jgi:hypothetical protein
MSQSSVACTKALVTSYCLSSRSNLAAIAMNILNNQPARVAAYVSCVVMFRC